MKKNHRTYTKSWRLTNTLLNNEWVTEKGQEKCKSPRTEWNQSITHQNPGHDESSPKWGISVKSAQYKIQRSQINNDAPYVGP